MIHVNYWLPGVCLALILSGCATNQPVADSADLAEIDTELAILDVNHGQAELAKAHLLEAHSLAPQDPLVLAGEGFYAVHMQEWSIAKNFYQAALDAAPNRPDIQDDYGAFLYQAKQYKAALPYFLEAAANQNNLYAKEAFQNAGLTELKLGHAAAARADFISARLSE